MVWHKSKAFLYSTALVGLGTTLSMAAVPLYNLVCSTTGIGGTPQTKAAKIMDKDRMERVKGAKPIKVSFSGNKSITMHWEFKPSQASVTVVPGETALAFFEAYNPTDKEISGIANYNILPGLAGQYFNKIQCFCFEEQILKPGERVEMPVFFYLDPEFAEDPELEDVDNIVLSYTFINTDSADQLIAASNNHHSWNKQE